ncbi:hypothetical protein QJS04_geneDACA016236 [Acorus gramineus]|uniref:Uncharacterized protein n=1 Tax=Acorus gramineus TaxID=55184 RepID=A0AAV9AHY1_ACOGR|nr:hypothetical protein QJS04_geneDACA016236 [Acorus gramineus]
MAESTDLNEREHLRRRPPDLPRRGHRVAMEANASEESQQLLIARLARKRQIYKTHKCTELKVAISELEHLW